MTSIKQKFNNNNIIKRFLSILIMMPTALLIFNASNLIFAAVFIILAAIMLHEWIAIVGGKKNSIRWLLVGFFYITVAVLSLIYLKSTDKALIYYLFICIWATDIGAYLFGILIGGPKLAPKISPSKSWSGAIGGLVLSTAMIAIIVHFNIMHFEKLIYLTPVISVAGQIGDLLESYFKRLFSVKDSGKLIPGHGGALDRMDSIMLAAPVLSLIIYLARNL